MTPINGMFYIDNNTGDFYLREAGAWVLKGSLRASGSSDGNNIITGSGPPPSGGVVGQAILVGTGAPS
jgi:hypothetical protein